MPLKAHTIVLIAASTPRTTIQNTGANASRASAIPSTACRTASLFANCEMPSNTGVNAFNALFCIIVKWSPQRFGIVSNCALISSIFSPIAFLITSAVTLPSAANCLSSPRLTPMVLAIMFSISGAFSAMLRNSSPCNCPDAMPCVNCNMAFFWASLLLPPMTNSF